MCGDKDSPLPTFLESLGVRITLQQMGEISAHAVEFAKSASGAGGTYF